MGEAFSRDFHSLSVRDLLDAREAYHVHLAHLENVVATAVGRYRIHRDDPAAKSPDPGAGKPFGKSEVRTLANTVVRRWSWPCVLVFVDRWARPEEMASRPDQTVPRRLYLPDGRVVPTCVLLAQRDPTPPPDVQRIHFGNEMMGGGYPCFVESQGTQRVGTVAGLVSREGITYALTNRHVAGERDQQVFTRVRGERRRIGPTADLHAGKKGFGEVYPGWSSSRTYVQMDAGLVRLDDMSSWTSQVFGIGEVGRLVDMNSDTITLDLVGAPVRFFGAASGPNEGEVCGLFYRYKSVGGFDYVADLLIGPRTANTRHRGKRAPRLDTRPGDSGALVFLDPPGQAGQLPPRSEGWDPVRRGEGSLDMHSDLRPDRGERARRLRPLAVQWGGERFKAADGGAAGQYALATFLSTICRVLDLDLNGDWQNGHFEYWGKAGHFKLGYAFCDLLSTPALRKLFKENRNLIGFPNARIEEGSGFSVGREGFVPLADVPDYRWVNSRPNEKEMHFADIDEEDPGGATLLAQCREDPERFLRAAAFVSYYDSLKNDDGYAPGGALPFRVRQIFEAMVGYAGKGDVLRFLCASGVLAHYVGDSCIPLHFSHLNHGHAPKVGREHPDFVEYRADPRYKVHALFEQRMFEVRPDDMLAAVDKSVKGFRARPGPKSGEEALALAFDLMHRTYGMLGPAEIVDSDAPSETPKNRAERLFDAVGLRAAKCLGEGCKVQATLVESAWALGTKHVPTGLKPFEEEDVEEVCGRADFLPAWSWDTMIRKGY
ncbi:MAG: hypothetical protein FJ087_03215 [Deltaproteobacteria bacterium]|nr:hypothetical protein [Deltaproteobacteria bacterium]